MKKIYNFKKGDYFILTPYESSDFEVDLIYKMGLEERKDYTIVIPKSGYNKLKVLKPFTITISLTYKPELT